MSYLSKFLLQEQSWRPARTNDLSTYEWFARELERFSKVRFERLPKELNCSSFSISFFYYKDFRGEANAFAAKLRRFKDRHVVAISQALVFDMHNALHSQVLKRFVDEKYHLINENFEEGKSTWMSFFTFCFITYHEVGHIIRGHSAYQAKVWNGPRKYYEMSGLRQSSYNRAYYLCEFDADGVGAKAVGVELIEKAKLLSIKTTKQILECMASLALLAAASICVLFLIFDSKRQGASAIYPAPMLRVASVLSFILDDITDQSTRAVIESAMTLGIKAGFDFANEEGLRKGVYNLTDALEGFYKIIPELEELELNLKDYIPARRKDTSTFSKLTGKAVRRSLQWAIAGV